MRSRIVWCVAIATTTVSASALEQAGVIIESRIASYREIGTAHKRIGDELKSRRPDLQQIEAASQLIHDKGAAMLRWFPPGSQPPAERSGGWLDRLFGWFSSDEDLPTELAFDSHARPEIWSQPAQFSEAVAKFQAAADAMRATAKSRQVDVIADRYRKLGATCKACHDVYRTELE
jgi:cytochrome c556